MLYESLIISLIMLGDVLGRLGESQGAHEVFDRAIAMAHAQGDRLHEVAALNNRRLTWIAEKDVARAAADLETQLEIGRGLGMVVLELVSAYNLGELLCQAGDAVAARPHVERAAALAARRTDIMPRPVARLLELRLLAFEERWPEVKALGAAIAKQHRGAQGGGRSDEQLLPSEELLLDAILLASGGGSDEAWAEVRARSKRCSEEQQAIEVVELQALGALRSGDLDAGAAAPRGGARGGARDPERHGAAAAPQARVARRALLGATRAARPTARCGRRDRSGSAPGGRA